MLLRVELLAGEVRHHMLFQFSDILCLWALQAVINHGCRCLLMNPCLKEHSTLLTAFTACLLMHPWYCLSPHGVSLSRLQLQHRPQALLPSMSPDLNEL